MPTCLKSASLALSFRKASRYAQLFSEKIHSFKAFHLCIFLKPQLTIFVNS